MSNVWRGYKCYTAEIFLVITQPRVELWGRAGGWRERLNLHETSTAACAMGVRREQTQLQAECGSVQEAAGDRYLLSGTRVSCSHCLHWFRAKLQLCPDKEACQAELNARSNGSTPWVSIL